MKPKTKQCKCLEIAKDHSLTCKGIETNIPIIKAHFKVCPLCLGKGKLLDKHHYSNKIRNKARQMYAKGIKLRDIGKELGINHPQKVKSLIMSYNL